jgi:hypothetical protein
MTTHTLPKLFPRISMTVTRSLSLRTRSPPDAALGRSGPLCSSGGKYGFAGKGKHFYIFPVVTWLLITIAETGEMAFWIYDSVRETGLSVHQSMPLGMI